MRSSLELVDRGDNALRERRGHAKDLADRPVDLTPGALVARGLALLADELIDPALRLQRLPEQISERDRRASHALIGGLKPELKILQVTSNDPFVRGRVHVQQIGRLATARRRSRGCVGRSPADPHATAQTASDSVSCSQSTRTALPADE